MINARKKMGEEISLEDFKETLKELRVTEARRGFVSHLAAYVIVNAFLVFINLWTSPGSLWFPFILAGWGIGLAFHYLASRPSRIIEEAERQIASIEYHARKRKKDAGQ
jgi:hypothetical protein